MKKIVFAAIMASFAFVQVPSTASAAQVIIKVKPKVPVVIVRKPCYYKTVKTYKANKVVIVKKRICP